jgi:threonine synthase
MDMWRYREALPRQSARVSLGEAVTPLLPLDCGGRRVWAKCEYQLPTGSYKDRGSAVLVSYLKEHGVEQAVEDSSGNAGASLAAYAARAGLGLRVFCPESASPGKLAQIALTGATLERIPGPRARATERLLEFVAQQPVVYASHLWNPLFLEGVKTMAFEIVEQLGWVAPAAVVCPVGAGSILLGLYRGFLELRQAAVIPRLPRLIAVQSENADSIHRAYHAEAERIAPITPKPTLAEGIALPGPVRDREILQALRCTGGQVVTVSESEIVQGLFALGRAGCCVEPTSAVVWPALLQLDRCQGLPASATVVCVLSGHGLKAASVIADIVAQEKDRHV